MQEEDTVGPYTAVKSALGAKDTGWVTEHTATISCGRYIMRQKPQRHLNPNLGEVSERNEAQFIF
jgi:hypothetical protein